MIVSSRLEPIKLWAYQNHNLFKKNGFGRQYGILQELNPPQEVWQIKDILIDKYNLKNSKQEPIFKDFCGYITDGGQVHKHKDSNQGNLIHTRFNVLIQKPTYGGMPVINNIELNIDEGQTWICRAGLDYHSSTMVKGDKPRIVISYGFLLGDNHDLPKN